MPYPFLKKTLKKILEDIFLILWMRVSLSPFLSLVATRGGIYLFEDIFLKKKFK